MTIPKSIPPVEPTASVAHLDQSNVIPEGDNPTTGIYAVDTTTDPAALRAALLSDAAGTGHPEYQADEVFQPTEQGMYRVPTEAARGALNPPAPARTEEPKAPEQEPAHPAPAAREEDEITMPDISDAAQRLIEGGRLRFTGLPKELAEAALRAKSDPEYARQLVARLNGQSETPAAEAVPPVAEAPPVPTPADLLAQMQGIRNRITEADPYDYEGIQALQAEMADAQFEYAKALAVPPPAPKPAVPEPLAEPAEAAYAAAFDADEDSVRRFVPDAFKANSAVRQQMDLIHRELTASANPADKATLESPNITSFLAEKALARLSEVQQTPGQVPGLRVAPGPAGSKAVSAQVRVETRVPASVSELNERLIQEGHSPADIRAALMRG